MTIWHDEMIAECDRIITDHDVEAARTFVEETCMELDNSIGEVMKMSFGERLSSILKERNMTRADLCRLTGLTSGHLTPYIKNPDRSPTLSTARKIALALDVSLDYLGGLIDEPKPIERAMDSCETSKTPVERHFADVGKMVEIGSGAKREVSDYKLTRYACYLIAMNGDTRAKTKEVAE